MFLCLVNKLKPKLGLTIKWAKLKHNIILVHEQVCVWDSFKIYVLLHVYLSKRSDIRLYKIVNKFMWYNLKLLFVIYNININKNKFIDLWKG